VGSEVATADLLRLAAIDMALQARGMHAMTPDVAIRRAGIRWRAWREGERRLRIAPAVPAERWT
jgi:hypothetical protein